MQDPLFQFAPEQAFDLNSFNSFLQNTGDKAVGGVGTASPSGEKLESDPKGDQQAVLDGETAQAYEEALKQMESEHEAIEPSTMAARIEEIQKHMNEHPVPIYGKRLYNRLLTLASQMNKEGHTVQANTICKALE